MADYRKLKQSLQCFANWRIPGCKIPLLYLHSSCKNFCGQPRYYRLINFNGHLLLFFWGVNVQASHMFFQCTTLRLKRWSIKGWILTVSCHSVFVVHQEEDTFERFWHAFTLWYRYLKKWRTTPYPSHFHVGKDWLITSYGLAASHHTVVLKCLLQGAQFGITKHRTTWFEVEDQVSVGWLCWHNPTLMTS